MDVLQLVIRATYDGEFRIRLTFTDSLQGIVDFQDWIKEGPVFEPLKDRTFFRRFFIEGGTVVWPNGADIAPETLYADLLFLFSVSGFFGPGRVP